MLGDLIHRLHHIGEQPEMGWRAATTWANVLALAAASATNPRCSDSIEAAATAGCLEAGPDAQDLHLGAGQKARSGPAWGAGLIEEVIEVDVFVAGGGSAGTSAALAAARSGASTVIVDGRPVLGGNSGSEIRVTMVGACGYDECPGLSAPWHRLDPTPALILTPQPQTAVGTGQ